MREIKFRVWVVEQKRMDPGGSLSTFSNPHYLSNCYTNIFLQYTGLKDKNGKEIYEGDIIHLCGTKYAAEVIYNQFGFEPWCSSAFEEEKIPQKEIEVIGNIYENLELLECDDD